MNELTLELTTGGILIRALLACLQEWKLVTISWYTVIYLNDLHYGSQGTCSNSS